MAYCSAWIGRRDRPNPRSAAEALLCDSTRWGSDTVHDPGLERPDGAFAAPVEGPLSAAFRGDESGFDEDQHMFARRRLASPELFGDAQPACPILDQVPVVLLLKMRTRVPQPFEDQQTTLVGQRPHGLDHRH